MGDWGLPKGKQSIKVLWAYLVGELLYNYQSTEYRLQTGNFVLTFLTDNIGLIHDLVQTLLSSVLNCIYTSQVDEVSLATNLNLWYEKYSFGKSSHPKTGRKDFEQGHLSRESLSSENFGGLFEKSASFIWMACFIFLWCPVIKRASKLKRNAWREFLWLKHLNYRVENVTK